MKIGIFLPNWIGDVVMATPTLRAVRNRFPDAEVLGIMRPYVGDVLAGTGLLDRSLDYHPRGKDADQRGLPFLRRLRAEKLDVALLLPNSLRSGMLAWLSGAKRRVGFARDFRGWLLTDKVRPRSRKTPHPVLNEYLRLAEALDCQICSRKTELAVLDEDQSALTRFWRDRQLDPGEQSQQASAREKPNYVCLNTGGAFGGAKNWPREYFAKLARRIATELNYAVLVVCGPAEREDARWIANASRHPKIFSLADEPLSIGLTKAAIRDARLLVTTDSGPRHFAAPFNTPVVTLFGPTHIAWSETFDPRSIHLQLKLECGPCQQRECPLRHHRCMRDLSAETVFDSVKRLLASHNNERKVA